MNGINGYNPICFWTVIPHDALARLLNDSGGLGWGDVNEPYNGATKLHWAAKYAKDPLVIKVLLDAGASKTAPDSDGKTPIEVAMGAGNAETTQALEDNAE